jgi:hypothetical protein
MRSLLIVTSLKNKEDLKALKLIKKYNKSLNWNPLEKLMIDEDVTINKDRINSNSS